MSETSTTSTDDQATGAAAADSTTSTDTNVGPDNQPANSGDNLNETSKSTDDTSADGDKTSTGDKSDEGKTSDDDTSNADDAPASKLDDDLDDWAAKRNMPPATTDEQKQAYQDLRNSQREYSRAKAAEKEAANPEELAKAAKDIKSEITDDTDDDDDDDSDPLEARVKELEAERNEERTTRLQSEFYQTNKVSDVEHKAILEIIKEKVARPATKEGKFQAFALWTNPNALPDLLELAKARVANSTSTDTLTEAARQEERERIAKESQANSTGRGAKTVSTGDKSPEQARLERFSNW